MAEEKQKGPKKKSAEKKPQPIHRRHGRGLGIRRHRHHNKSNKMLEFARLVNHSPRPDITKGLLSARIYEQLGEEVRLLTGHHDDGTPIYRDKWSFRNGKRQGFQLTF